MPEIRQLPTSVINKIAAGEVIERPASVVKELMENAVDAGATRVDLSVEQGGRQRVRVTDNGCGMRSDQLMLAIASHATSKIQDADDLFQVSTLGFRGEALASIADISHFHVRSRTSYDSSGAELEVVGGEARDIAPCGAPVGTSIDVANLFFNTPVRRKFLKTNQTELGHCTEAFIRIAMPNPDVHFTMRHNERTIYDLPPVDNWKQRILGIYREFADGLIRVDSGEGEIRVSGFVTDPSFSRANNRMQYLFLNGRHIRDRALHHALAEAYRGLLLTGRHPISFLKIELPASIVDVNVHPTKLEVRFEDSGAVYSRLLSTIRTKFLSTDLTSPETSQESESVAESTSHEQQLTAWARGSDRGESQQSNLNLSASPPALPSSLTAPRGDWAASTTEPRTGYGDGAGSSGSAFGGSTLGSSSLGDASFQGYGAADNSSAQPQHRFDSPHQLAPTTMSHRGIQIHNRYLVAQTDGGMIVIDQHALHERVLYEQLRSKVLDGTVEVQRLLVPETLTLTSQEVAAVMDAAEDLERVGIWVEPFGGDTVAVTGYPAMLAKMGPAEILRQAIEFLMSGKGEAIDRRDLVDSLLHMMSCKAAVKAGDPLTPEEITALLEDRDLCQDAHHCPHGRPTGLVFTNEELDKRFKRT